MLPEDTVMDGCVCTVLPEDAVMDGCVYYLRMLGWMAVCATCGCCDGLLCVLPEDTVMDGCVGNLRIL